jgi:hypothetical protein
MCPYPQIGIVISDPFQLYVGGGNKYTGDPGGHITYGVTIKSIKTPEEIKSRGLCDQWNLNDSTFFNTPAQQFKEQFGVDDKRYDELKARFEELCALNKDKI